VEGSNDCPLLSLAGHGNTNPDRKSRFSERVLSEQAIEWLTVKRCHMLSAPHIITRPRTWGGVTGLRDPG